MIKNIFKSLFTSKKVKNLEAQIVFLEAKLKEKQEHIDKTNAYWKKQLKNAKALKMSQHDKHEF